MKKEIALEERKEDGERLFSPSAARNKNVIRDAFASIAPTIGDVLEVGAGTGEHAVTLAGAAPGVTWRPGDPDAKSRASINAWAKESGLPNIAPAHAINVADDDWGLGPDRMLAGVVSINMIHIAPFAAAKGLFGGAGRYLRVGGVLFLYGPFSRNGVHTAPSNEEFDRSLKARDPDWGVRDLDLDLAPLAEAAGLALFNAIEMPANNLSAVFKKTG
ncbi:MAG: DUF938 domain-containing protein [Pseudomonadota bacterium]